MSNNWFKLHDPNGRLGDYTLMLEGNLYYEGQAVGMVRGNEVIADYQIGHFDKPNEKVECRGEIQDGWLKMQNGESYQLVPIERSELPV